MNALISFIRAPWQVFAVLAVLAIAFGISFANDDRQRAAKKAQALADGPPPVTDLAAFDFERDKRYMNEVNVRVWVDTSLSTGLTLTTVQKGTDRVENRVLYFLFDPAETRASGQVRAVVNLPESETDRFASYMMANSTDIAPDKLVFTLSGLARQGHTGSFNDLIDRAIAQAGLTKAPGFMVITPWLDGREAVLTTGPAAGSQSLQFFGALGGVLALIGLVKFLLRPRTRRPRVAPPLA